MGRPPHPHTVPRNFRSYAFWSNPIDRTLTTCAVINTVVLHVFIHTVVSYGDVSST